jgi:hypothetical protein
MPRRPNPDSKQAARVPNRLVPKRLVPIGLVPKWLHPLVVAFSALCLLGWFSPEISDPDFWWHLKTGQYIAETHSLPVPDPFAYTTSMARPSSTAEPRTRQFNLTHEWLAQVLMYSIYRAGGFAAIVLARAAALAGFCALVGLVAYHRRRSFWASVAAAFAAASVAGTFTADRPYQITFLLLAVTLVVVETARSETGHWERGHWETGRRLWLLPPLFLVWGNCHGGYFLGWVVLGAYSAEALVLSLRKQPAPGARRSWPGRLWLVSAISVLVCGINPNGFRIFAVLLAYRGSFLQNRLLEWAKPSLWPPQAFSVLLVAAGGVMLWAHRRVRIADWLLYALFAAAALSAQRNMILIALTAPVFIVAYFPGSLRLPAWSEFALLLLVVGSLASGLARGNFFQLRPADWRYPAGAADFLLANHIGQPLFNTYEYGGYLMWRLWPRERVFIDGRALSESVFMDYARILYNHDESDGGKTADQLLDAYGVQVIVMNSFEYTTGPVYMLAPALADPKQTSWKLVFQDPQALVFMRHPPPQIRALDSLQVLSHMEDECALHIEREPQYPRCARGLGQVFSKIGDYARARKWIGEYLSHPHAPDLEAEQAYQNLGR